MPLGLNGKGPKNRPSETSNILSLRFLLDSKRYFLRKALKRRDQGYKSADVYQNNFMLVCGSDMDTRPSVHNQGFKGLRVYSLPLTPVHKKSPTGRQGMFFENLVFSVYGIRRNLFWSQTSLLLPTISLAACNAR